MRNRPEWIGEHREVRDLLLVRWGDPARMRELMATPTTGVDTRFRREHRQLVTCLVEYCRLRPDDFDMLFELLDVFAPSSAPRSARTASSACCASTWRTRLRWRSAARCSSALSST